MNNDNFALLNSMVSWQRWIRDGGGDDHCILHVRVLRSCGCLSYKAYSHTWKKHPYSKQYRPWYFAAAYFRHTGSDVLCKSDATTREELSSLVFPLFSPPFFSPSGFFKPTTLSGRTLRLFLSLLSLSLFFLLCYAPSNITSRSTWHT